MDNNESRVTKSALQILIEEAGYDTRAYSGRGRYDKSDLGVDLGDQHLAGFIADLMTTLTGMDTDEVDPSLFDAIDQFRSMRTDSMGRGTIVYFPGVEYGTVDADEEDPDSGDEGS